MRNVRVQLAAAALIVCCGASLALACGIQFAWQLLDNRAATLDTMPVIANSFAFLEAHLIPAPADNLTAKATDPGDETREDGSADAVADLETNGLSSEQTEALRTMRAEPSGDSAFDQGGLLPVSVRMYTAGAVDFHKGDMNKATKRFRSVLELPADQRRDREVWAAYMLGRIYAGRGDAAEASRSFALTRDLVKNGAPDPLGLGVASFGEEARIHLKRAEALQKINKKSPDRQRRYGQEIREAVRLYAEQAAHGSSSGVDSLRYVVDDVISDYTVDALICDPLVQRLLVSRSLDGDAGAPDNWEGETASRISWFVASVRKCGAKNITEADKLAAIAYRNGDFRTAQTLASQTHTPLALWVRARLAMQKGDTAEAARYYAEASKAFPSSGEINASDKGVEALLVGESSVLTLSRGEYVDALEQLYPYSATYWGDVAYIAERVLTVDELKTFVDTHKDTPMEPPNSLESLAIPGESVGDWFFYTEDKDPAAHMRSLLARRLVRAHRYEEALRYLPPPTAAPTVAAPAINVAPTVTYENRVKAGYENGVPKAGTIFMHEGIPRAVGGAVAQGLFPLGVGISGDAVRQNQQPAQQQSVSRYRRRFGGPPSRYAPWVKFVRGRRVPLEKPKPEGGTVSYVEALNQAQAAKSEVERARAWYTAATLAADFRSGAEIMGTEGTPDYVGDGGSYTGGVGQSELKPDDRLVTDGERQRFEASASAKPDFRYHYLFVGTDEAIRGADLLPPRSQAFAAVMCNATSWMMDGNLCPASASDLRASPTAYASNTQQIANPITVDQSWPDEDTARINLACQLYQRYLKEGAVVPWAKYFGRGCPDPDFDRAVGFTERQTLRETRRRQRMIRHRWVVTLKLAVILAVLIASTWWFVRHRYV